MDPALLQFLTVLGAAGALVWILRPMLPLHSDSEVQGLRADKVELMAEVKESRAVMAEVAPLLRDVLALLGEGEEVGEP